jgi:hypothetical protein
MKSRFYLHGCMVLGILGMLLSCGLIVIGVVAVVNRIFV